MSRKIYFAVLRGLRGEEPVLFHDHFSPSAYERTRLIYACLLPSHIVAVNLNGMMQDYQCAKAKGTLLPNLVKK